MKIPGADDAAHHRHRGAEETELTNELAAVVGRHRGLRRPIHAWSGKEIRIVGPGLFVIFPVRPTTWRAGPTAPKGSSARTGNSARSN